MISGDNRPRLADLVRERVVALRNAGGQDDDACSLEHPPLSESQVAAAEARLGFTIPAALRSMYLDVGNGGFGPAYGLLGLVGGARQEDGYDAIEMRECYLAPRESDPHWTWPQALLPVVHLGCAMFFCVDISMPQGDVVWFEPNPHEARQPWTDSFIPLNVTFERLMSEWATGLDLVKLMEAACNTAGEP